MLEIVVVALPVKAVPPALSKVQFAPAPPGATHFNPVVSTLSATMLQLGKGIILASAQSCAIVVDTIG